MVKISIIMPVYNSQDYLKESIESIINQSFEDFELICVDDGSNDDSFNILNDYANSDSRIRLISQKNKGAGSARNKGLKSSLGDYIFFMDADDYIVPEFLQKVYNNMTSTDSDMVIYKIGDIAKNKKVNKKPYFPFDEIFPNVDFNKFTFNYKSVKEYVLNKHFAPWMKFYRKSFLEKFDDFLFDEELPYEDILFHVKSMLRSSKISFIPEYLYYYRIDSLNSSTSNQKNHIEIFKVIEIVSAFLKNENYFEEFEKEFEFFKLRQTTVHISQDFDEIYFKKAKNYLNGIDLDKNEVIPPNHKKIFQIFFNSQDSVIYNQSRRIYLLSYQRDKLEITNEELVNENIKLNELRKQEKNKKQQLESSRSWRITKIFRGVF